MCGKLTPELAATRTQSRGEVHNTYLAVLIAACLVGLATLLVYGLFIHGLRQRNFWMTAGLIVAVPGILKAGRETTVPAEREGPGTAGDRAA